MTEKRNRCKMSAMTETNKEKTNIEPNVAAALSYLVTPITGILFFVKEKDDKFVRFHAFQSILFGIVSFGCITIAESLKVLVIGFLVTPLVNAAIFAMWLFLMWKAYNNEEYEIPYLGKIAKNEIDKKHSK